MEAESVNQPSVPRGEEVETLAAGAVDWMIGAACSTDGGLTLASTANGDEADRTLYSGGAGIVLALLEARCHFRDDRYGDAALRGAAVLAAAVDGEDDCSLYFGIRT